MLKKIYQLVFENRVRCSNCNSDSFNVIIEYTVEKKDVVCKGCRTPFRYDVSEK